MRYTAWRSLAQTGRSPRQYAENMSDLTAEDEDGCLLFRLYRVIRQEDNSVVEDAFVLPVKHDPAAWLAAWHYAGLTANAELARQLRAWLIDNTPQEDHLDTEGQRNREALEKVRDVVTSYKDVND